MARPHPGDWQSRYWSMGRVDLAKTTESGWWLTIWTCRPPPKHVRFRVLRETWIGPVRIIREGQALDGSPTVAP